LLSARVMPWARSTSKRGLRCDDRILRPTATSEVGRRKVTNR
jgi:hypothetical protein